MTVKGAVQRLVKAIKLFIAVLDVMDLLGLVLIAVFGVAALVWSVMLALP